MSERIESTTRGGDGGRDRPRRPTREPEPREQELEPPPPLARGSTRVATADIARATKASRAKPGVAVPVPEVATRESARSMPRRASSRELTMRGAGRRDPTLVAAVVLAAYLGQAFFQVEIAWLAAWQQDEIYRLATGGALAAFLALQWLLARTCRDVHVWLGAFAPVALYAHATQLAYGYLAWLVVVYLGVAATGLLHRPIIARRARRTYIAWFVTHLALSVLMIVLVAYHVVIAVAYE